MKRTLLIIAGIAVLLFSLSAAAFGAMRWRFTPDIPEADYPEPQTAIEARKQDLDYLRKYPKVDKSFSEAHLVSFEALVDDLEARADTISEAEFIMGVSAASAMSENAHSGVSAAGTMNRLNSLPIRFAWFGDGLHIVRAHGEHADLIGSRVIAYDGKSPEDLYRALDAYFPGNDAFLRQNSSIYLAAPASLHAAGLIAEPNTVSLELVSPDGDTITRSLTVESEATAFFSPGRSLIGELHENEEESGHDWRTLDPVTTGETWFARHPSRVLWSDQLPFGGVYWRMRNIVGDDQNALPDWLEEQSDILRRNPVEYLVLDLRANGGGDYTKAMTVAREIGELVEPDGRVYILVDGNTFSAAIVTAYYALHGAGERAVLVGEPMGDDLQFWAEGGGTPMSLPNSGIKLYASTGYHDWENGCSDWSRCFWLNILYDVAVGEAEIDLPAPMLFSEYSRGIDSGMKAILSAEKARIGEGPN